MAYRSRSAVVSWRWFAPAVRCSCYDTPPQWSPCVVVSPLTEGEGEKWREGGGGRGKVMKLSRKERREDNKAMQGGERK